MRPIRRTLAAVAALALLPLGLASPAQAAPAAFPQQAPAAPATPQGLLKSTACTGSPGAVTCDLWAKAGTTTVAGTPIPIWGFASTDAALPSTPGPLLLLTQNDTVTITVHNGLASNLSLAIPDQTGLASDPTGAAPGSTATYTFTASRPGTYLYEAGHTADGARQAAMGLVGAMVVRPATGPNTAYGDPAGAFDDEAALVLSEIDPAFNANPTGFDLRNYHPVYKLINGKAFPETDPVATAVGHTVLLRYVNAGLTDHAMGVIGTRQTIVGADARANPDAYPLVADTIPPGQTEDAVVPAPAAVDGAKFVVYETHGRLDNAGAFTASTGSTQVAFGGMMTYLTTDAVAPPGDTFGPVTSAVTLTPTAITAKDSVHVTANISDVANGNSAVAKAEYVIDNPGATAVGFGTPLTGAFGGPTVTGAAADIPTAVLQGLTQGKHLVYVRALDSAGNWGPVSSASFTLTKTGPTTTATSVNPAVTNGTANLALAATGDDTGLGGTITAAEYYIGGTAPAPGSGTAMTLAQGSTPAIAAETATIPAATVSALADGATTVSVRSKDSFGLWGPVQTVPLTVTRSGPAAAVPTFDPNPTDGTVGSKIDPTQISVSSTFTEPGTPALSAVAGGEGFLDTPGNPGTGFVFLAKDGKFDSATETAYGLIPLSQVTGLTNGTHQVYVHGRDAAGNWGSFSQGTLTVDRGVVVGNVAAALTPNTPPGAPAVAGGTTAIALSATGTAATGAPSAAEWFLDADPGAGNGRPMTIGAATGQAYPLTASVPPGGLTVGQHTLSVRARSAAGAWGRPASTTVTVSALSNLLFKDTFDTSTVSWASQVGNPAVTGGQLAPAVGSYVVDTTPLNEGRYTASFSFTPGAFATTTTGTAVIFKTLTSTNGEVYSVQYQKLTNGYRVQLSRGTATSGWVSVTGANAAGIANALNTPRTISVVFTTTANSSIATLTVSAGGTGVTVGGSPRTLTGARATATLRVDTVQLGVISASTGTTGSPLIDNFTSQRT